MTVTAVAVGTTPIAIAPATTQEAGRSCVPSPGASLPALARSIIIQNIIVLAVTTSLPIGRRAMIPIIAALTVITRLSLLFEY